MSGRPLRGNAGVSSDNAGAIPAATYQVSKRAAPRPSSSLTTAQDGRRIRRVQYWCSVSRDWIYGQSLD